MKILTTGHRSGFGRHLYEKFGGLGLDVDTPEQAWDDFHKADLDVLVHCAFNHERNLTTERLAAYLRDNVELTRRLLAVPHPKFVFISSIDVYPKNSTIHTEHEPIPLDQVTGIYAITKLISEALVREHSSRHLILRCSAFLGTHTRPNTLLKILESDSCQVTVSPTSVFNYVRHDDVSDFIRLAVERDLTGTYNAVSAENVTLADLVKRLGRHVRYGTFTYHAGQVSNAKIRAHAPAFARGSWATVQKFTTEDLVVSPAENPGRSGKK